MFCSSQMLQTFLRRKWWERKTICNLWLYVNLQLKQLLGPQGSASSGRSGGVRTTGQGTGTAWSIQDSKYFQDPWFLGTGLTLIQTLASILQLPNSSSNHKFQSPGPWITIKLHLSMLSWGTVTSSSIVIVGFFYTPPFSDFLNKMNLIANAFQLKKNLFSLITHQTKIDS